MAKKTSSKKLRIAFIGSGAIAGHHMDFLSKMNDVEIVALADISEPAMARYVDRFKVPKDNCFTDYKQMLAKVQPDAVSVCTANGLHAAATIAALKAGAHVLVEKPMAMNAKDAQAMVDTAHKQKRKLVIGFQQRYSANSMMLRRSVASGRFGKIMYVRCQALRRRGIPNWGVFGRKDLQGGGPMIDIGVHILEVAHFVMGSPRPIAASGNTWTYMGNKKSDVASMWPNWDYKSYTVEDLAVGQIRFDNGAILSIEASFAAHIPQDVMNFSIMGEKSGATWDPAVIYHDDDGYMLNSTPGYLPAINFFEKKMRNFVEHALYNKPTMAPAEHGLMVQKMLDGVYASAEHGGEVKIK
jgi:predicted dehydrogenase